MFAPKVGKPQTKSTAISTSNLAHQRSTLVAPRPSYGSVQEALLLQGTIGNQATLRLLAQRASNSIGNASGGGYEQEAAPENITARDAARGIARSFSEIPISPPDRTNRPQAPSPLTALRPPGAIQAKLVVGQVNDPREHEADRVADQVMRMPGPEVSVGSAPPQIGFPPSVSTGSPHVQRCARSCDNGKTENLQTKRAGTTPALGSFNRS